MDDRRSRSSALVVLLVAVLVGLGVGRFATADGEGAVTTTTVAASADLPARISQLEDAVASDPEDWQSLQGLAVAYLQRAVESGDASFYALAGTALDRAERLQPGDTGMLVARGALSLSLHEFDAALAAGTAALAKNPDSATVLGIVADAQVELGRYDQAADTLQDMLDRDPGLPALARASYQRELRGDLSGALAAMRAAVGTATSASDRARVQVLLAGLLVQAGDVDTATAALDDARRLVPGLASARVAAARVLAARGDLAGAVASLQTLTAEQPTVEGLVLLESLQRASGDVDGAAQTAGVVRAVAALAEDAGQVVDLEMALFEADAGDPARALELGRAVHEARPDNVYAADALAWTLLRSGDVAGAQQAMRTALRLGTTTPSVRWHAAEIAAAAGDVEAAREHLRTVLEAAPWTASVEVPAVRALAERLAVPLPAAWSAD